MRIATSFFRVMMVSYIATVQAAPAQMSTKPVVGQAATASPVAVTDSAPAAGR